MPCHAGCTSCNAFHAAQALANKLAHEHPGLVFEVAEDKVWGGAYVRPTPGGGENAQKESHSTSPSTS